MQGVQVNPTEGTSAFFWDVTPEWLVVCDMQRVAGRLVISSLRIKPVGPVPEGGLTIDVLKAVRLAPVRAYAALNSPPPASVRVKQKSGGDRGRPQLRTTRFYREVWERYGALVQSRSKHPAKVLAQEYEKHGYTRTGMRSLLKRLRENPRLRGADVSKQQENRDGKTTRTRGR